MKRLVILAGLIAAIAYCGPNGEFKNGNQSNANLTSKNTSTSRGNSPSPGPAPAPSPGGNDLSPGESFFNLTVKPAFAGCASGAACHKDGGAGFLGLPFNYSQAKAKLAGIDAKSSEFYQKIRGKPSHGGGDTCSTGDNASPCKEVIEWWTKENPSNGGGNGSNTNTNTSRGTGTGTGIALRGEAFFTANVAPKLTNCSGCHTNTQRPLTYATARPLLKSTNATRDNNSLINNASGIDHQGGNVCGSKTASPCAEFQQWFDVEP